MTERTSSELDEGIQVGIIYEGLVHMQEGIVQWYSGRLYKY